MLLFTHHFQNMPIAKRLQRAHVQTHCDQVNQPPAHSEAVGHNTPLRGGIDRPNMHWHILIARSFGMAHGTMCKTWIFNLSSMLQRCLFVVDAFNPLTLFSYNPARGSLAHSLCDFPTSACVCCFRKDRKSTWREAKTYCLSSICQMQTALSLQRLWQLLFGCVGQKR